MGIIRLLLALSVVASHFGGILGCKFIGGQVAVQSFYIISGFYMTMILNEKYIGINKSYKLFITNRLIRLYPVYWTVLLITVAASFFMMINKLPYQFPQLSSYLSVKTNPFSFLFLVITNIGIVGQDVVMFLGITPQNGHLFFTSNFWNTNPKLYEFLFLPQAWTLSLEIMFYLIAPFILRKGHKIVLGIIIASFLLRLIIFKYLGLHNDPWTCRFFPTEIMFFLFGYFSYKLNLNIKKLKISGWFNMLTLLFAICFTIFYVYIPSIKLRNFPFTIKELAYFSSITISIPFLFNFFKKSKIDRAIGELSYPVYISHYLVGLCCSFLPLAFLRSGWAIALAAIFLAYILNKAIANPIEKYRQSRLKT
jgi:peptidoglycan/LPS O-acetylase OafA/YrhL